MIQFDNAINYFGKVILDELKENGIYAYIAGGAVRDYFMNAKMKTDYDIFFTNEDDFNKALNYLKLNGCTILWESSNAVKVSYYKRKFDLVRHHFASPDEMINSFDFTVSMFAVDTEKIYHSETAFIDLAKRQLILNNVLIYPNNTMQRAFRYYEKGFKMCVGEMQKLALAVTRFNNEMEEKKKQEDRDSHSGNKSNADESDEIISSPDGNGFFGSID